MFKHPRRAIPILAVVIVCCAAWVGGAVASERSTSAGKADGLGSSYDVSKAGDVTLTLWWLGDQEVPGIQAWMKKVIASYQKLHPNVTVKAVVQSTGTWTQTQHIACQGKSGPDLWYNWAGTWSLEQAWQGCTVPNETVLSASDLAHNTNVAETKWQGKTWVYPLYRFVYPIVYNKALFKQAGLDPNKPSADLGCLHRRLQEAEGGRRTADSARPQGRLRGRDRRVGLVPEAGLQQLQRPDQADGRRQLLGCEVEVLDHARGAAEAVCQQRRQLAELRRRAHAVPGR